MAVMTSLSRSGPLTVADLESMPDDGRRHELINGSIIVTPAPLTRHQIVVGELFVRLRLGCPADLRVLTAPTDVVLDVGTVLQPDLLVARRSDLTEKNLPVPPLLAVEVLSPSTALIDLNLKRARFEAAGVRSYWVVDPDLPRLIAWELREGAYVEVADVSGGEEWTAELPFTVTIRPSDLLD